MSDRTQPLHRHFALMREPFPPKKDPFGPPSGMFRAELEEGYAAGRKGPTCPFCGSRETYSEILRDWSGVLSEDWGCSNCDESGWVLDGRLLYVPEGEAA